MRRKLISLFILAALSPVLWVIFNSDACAQQQAAVKLTLPLKEKSLRFGVIGDSGSGDRVQYQVGEQLARYREAAGFNVVVMMGDNIYGAETESGYRKKFELPYKRLLDAGTKFYASLGNHDNPNERFYKHFNMQGKRYYSFKEGPAEFFALDSTYMDAQQLAWIEREISTSSAKWKICFFHHPLYSSAGRHGSDLDLRRRLEPIFEKAGVSVVLTGHDHVYERIKPQKGIPYWVVGSSGKLRSGDVRASSITAKSFDRDLAFMIVEIAGDEFHFQAISRTGATVDSGVYTRQENGREKTTTTAAGR